MIGYQNPNVLGFTLFASRIGNKALNSAWMMVGKGIRLVSPFGGFL